MALGRMVAKCSEVKMCLHIFMSKRRNGAIYGGVIFLPPYRAWSYGRVVSEVKVFTFFYERAEERNEEERHFYPAVN